MKNKKKLRRRIVLFAVLLFCVFVPRDFVRAEEKKADVVIASTEEFLTFARSATQDNTYVGKTVRLAADISLDGVAFEPIATFGGTFDGGGHTISGLMVTGVFSPAGLFGILQEEGEIRNLAVEGSVVPEGSRLSVGGIVGENYGVLWECSFSGEVSGKDCTGGIVGINRENGDIRYVGFLGTVSGEKHTGGIAGYNHGTIGSCESSGEVNTGSSTASMVSDTGGIAGCSVGMVLSCTNYSTVGYPHLGYNVGGIVGRNGGFVNDSENHGKILGRKDVGGIAGQLEPDIIEGTRTTQDWLILLREEMNELSVLVEKAINDGEGASLAVSGRLTKISSHVNRTTDKLEDLTGDMTDYADSVVEEVNRLGIIASDVSARMKGISDRGLALYELAEGGVDKLKKSFEELKKAFELLDGFDIDITAVMEAADNAIADMKIAVNAAETAMVQVGNGMGDLEEAIVVKDQQTVDWAMQNMIDGMQSLAWAMGDLSWAMSELVSVLNDLENALNDFVSEGAASTAETVITPTPLLPGEELGDLGDVLENLEDLEQITEMLTLLAETATRMSGAMSDMASAMSGAAASMENILDATTTIMENVSVDLKKTKDGMGKIRDAVYVLGGSMSSLSDSIADMEVMLEEAETVYNGAKEDIGKISEQFLLAMDVFSEAGDIFREVYGNSGELLEECATLVDYLEQAETVKLSEPGDAVSVSADEVYASFDALTEEMELLNREADGQVGILAEDLRNINDQFNVVFNTFFDALHAWEQASEEDLVVDTSGENMNSMLDGKLYRCINYGPIEADTCVGGIIGSMAVENELDPEDDLSEGLFAVNVRYEQRAVAQEVVNYGRVLSKKDYVGGICGRMELGLLYGSENYGTVGTDTGDYVGGIAGLADAVIKYCYAKCGLYGAHYIGGVLGAGAEAGTDSACVVENCLTMVEISSYIQYAGGISGIEEGEFAENYFVSDVLQGLNRRSLRGIAQPVSYAELLTMEKLPEEFTYFTLRFADGEEEIAKTEFSYDTSFGAEVLPPLPEKTGYFAVWEETEFQNLRFDKTVQVIYTPLLTALASEAVREDGRPVFLLEGVFCQEDEMRAEATEVSAEGFIMLARNIEETLLDYMRFMEKGTMPDDSVNYEIEEQWRLTVPADRAKKHVFRYLPENGKTDGLDIYIKKNDEWKKVQTSVMGSYLLFEAEGETVEILVLSTIRVWWMWMLAMIGVLTIATFGVKMVMVLKKKKRTMKIKEKAECTEYERA